MEASATSISTQYGAPRTTVFSTAPVSHSYTFIPAVGRALCYICPASMHVYTGTAGTNIKYANGYNPAIWEFGTYSGTGINRVQTGGGFSVDLMDREKSNGTIPDIFPTTGFRGAMFSLIGSGNDQSNYRCTTSSSATIIKLSAAGATTTLGKGCEVTYTAADLPTF